MDATPTKELIVLRWIIDSPSVRCHMVHPDWIADASDVANILEYIVDSIADTYSDITIDTLQELYLSSITLTGARKRLYIELFDRLRKIQLPCDDGVVLKMIDNLRKEYEAADIARLCLDVINNRHDVTIEDVYIRVNTLQANNTSALDGTDTIDSIPSCLDELKNDYIADVEFPFKLSSLADKVSGLRRGDLCIVFARPETGKSTWCAYQNVHWLKLGHKVLHLCNEEQAYKIMLNHIRSCEGKSSEELQQLTSDDLTEWNKIRDNYTLVDITGKSVDDIKKLLDKVQPDVLVIDNADKPSIRGTYQGNHDKLEALYITWRESAKSYDCSCVAVSQASADAQNRLVLTADMMAGSKTGKYQEADIIIGLGRKDIDADGSDSMHRCLTISKNKITGWHGSIGCMINPKIARYYE